MNLEPMACQRGSGIGAIVHSFDTEILYLLKTNRNRPAGWVGG